MKYSVANNNKKIFEHDTELRQLSSQKLDTNKFLEALEDVSKKIETVTYAAYDIHRVLKQTDNFIEKYLPFTIQNIVSKNINSFLHPPPKAKFDAESGKTQPPKPREEWTQAESLCYDWYEKYKAAEYDVYKEFHRVILNDDGVAALKKTAFSMPGYRKVLEGSKIQEYVIDNEVV